MHAWGLFSSSSTAPPNSQRRSLSVNRCKLGLYFPPVFALDRSLVCSVPQSRRFVLELSKHASCAHAPDRASQRQEIQEVVYGTASGTATKRTLRGIRALR